MPSKSGQSRRKNAEWEWKGFVNFSLGNTDKKNVKKRADSLSALLYELYDVLEEGYEVKLSYDDKSSCASVMVIGKQCPEFNRGWAMSCRHSDLGIAIAGVLYQHSDLSGDSHEWPKPTDEGGEFNW